MKFLPVAVLAAAIVAVLASCAATTQIDTSPRKVTLEDGATVTCVLAIDKANGGSASPPCNWERYNQLHPVSAVASQNFRS